MLLFLLFCCFVVCCPSFVLNLVWFVCICVFFFCNAQYKKPRNQETKGTKRDKKGKKGTKRTTKKNIKNKKKGQKEQQKMASSSLASASVRRRMGSNSYGSLWFGGQSFPGFLYKKNTGVGGRRSTQFTPGGTTLCNQPNEFWNKYTPGSGVGGSSVAVRRAKMIHATVCGHNQQCGRFYVQLGQNQIRPTPYTHAVTNVFN